MALIAAVPMPNGKVRRTRGVVGVKGWATIGVAVAIGSASPVAAVARAQQSASETPPPKAVEMVRDAIKALENDQARNKRSRAAAPSGNPGQFFGEDDYPPSALRAGEQGRVVAKLNVGPDGQVTACAIDVSSGSTALDDKTCEIALAKVTFAPATDERGRPIASTYPLAVRWVMPEEVLWPFARWSVSARMRIDGAGKVLSCSDERDGPVPRQDVDPCGEFGDPAGDFALALGGGSGAGEKTIVITTAFLPANPANPAPPTNLGDVVGFGAVRLTIGPNGNVAACAPLTMTGRFADRPFLCEAAPGPFEPLAKGASPVDRTGVFTMAIASRG